MRCCRKGQKRVASSSSETGSEDESSEDDEGDDEGESEDSGSDYDASKKVKVVQRAGTGPFLKANSVQCIIAERKVDGKQEFRVRFKGALQMIVRGPRFRCMCCVRKQPRGLR